MKHARLWCAVALMATAAFAEDLTLVDGRYLHVKVVRGDGAGVEVTLLDTQGTLFIPWDRILERDRDRLQIALGIKEQALELPMEQGVRLEMKTGDIFLGRLVREDKENIVLRIAGRDEELKLAMVRDRTEEMIPINVAEKPETLYKERLEETAPGDGDIPAHEDLAKFAAALQLYDEAYFHLTKVQEADPQYRQAEIANQVERMKVLATGKAFRKELDEIRRDILHALFPRAFSRLDALEKAPDLPPAFLAEINTIREMGVKARTEHFRKIVRSQYLATMRSKIREKARLEPKEFKLPDAQKWLRTQLHKEIVGTLAERHKLDSKEVEELWKDRRLFADNSESYGSGTFIVVGANPEMQKYQAELQRYLQQEAARNSQRGRNNNQGGSLQPEGAKLPKPPTKDEWWARARSTDRESWMRCYWAENSKNVTVLRERWDDCGHCGATGLLSIEGAQGEPIRVTCTVCQGHKRHKGVVYK